MFNDPNDRGTFEKKIFQDHEPKYYVLDSRLKYYDLVVRIDLSLLQDIDYSINFFPLPDDEEFSYLVQSIGTYGILTPLLVQKDKNSDKYIVISGRSRLAALYTLYNQNFDEQYLYAPCLILDESVDLETIKGIIISTNLAYRKLPKDVQIKAILFLDEMLAKSRRFKRELNLTKEIADRAGISMSTANSIRGFKNLSKLALDLLFKDHISRGVARLLSMINGHKKQDAIINKLGNEINNINKVKALIEEQKAAEKKVEVHKKDTNPALPPVPKNTKIELYVHQDEVEDVLNSLINLKGKAVLKFNILKDGEIDKYLRVNLNENHMNQYIKNNIVTKGTVDLVRSLDHKELLKYS